MTDGLLASRVVGFSKMVVELSKQLDEKAQYVMSKQLVASATAIGASIFEAQDCESRPDFIHKFKIASKEARETGYWLEIVSSIIAVDQQLKDELTIIHKMINKSIVTAKQNLRR